MKLPEFKELKLKDETAICMAKYGRAQWVNVVKPDTRYAKRNEHGVPIEGTYSCVLLIPKKASKKFIADLTRTVETLVNNSKVFVNAKERKEALKTALTIGGEGALLKDGDNIIKEATGLPYPGNEGMYLFKAKTYAISKGGVLQPRYAIGVTDVYNKPLPGEDIPQELYAGCWINLQVAIKPQKTNKFLGVTTYLNSIQKLQDDDPIGGGGYFEDESESFATDSEDGSDLPDD